MCDDRHREGRGRRKEKAETETEKKIDKKKKKLGQIQKMEARHRFLRIYKLKDFGLLKIHHLEGRENLQGRSSCEKMKANLNCRSGNGCKCPWFFLICNVDCYIWP